jgi:hypothetical protein
VLLFSVNRAGRVDLFDLFASFGFPDENTPEPYRFGGVAVTDRNIEAEATTDLS